jgi:hypothetical protein
MQLGYFVLALASILLLLVSRHLVVTVFLAAVIVLSACPGLMIGGLNIYAVRVLILAGLVRALARPSERPAIFPVATDWILVLFVVAALFASVFHHSIQKTFIANAGTASDAFFSYVLFRRWITSLDDAVWYLKSLLIILIPVAVLMLFQYATDRNLFSYLGGVLTKAELRNGLVRANGPFRSALIAGTEAAVCLPICIAFWRSGKKSERLLAKAGLFASVAIPFTATASGPLMTLGFGIVAMVVWKQRSRLRLILRLSLVALIVLHLVMKAPVWYLMAHIDLSGGSNGWFRARLIDAAIDHFREWWLGGTDFTKDWMPTGVTWSEDNSDICNHYILMGVVGGLPLMVIFIAIIASCFRHLRRAFQTLPDAMFRNKFIVWSLGAMLFAHAATMFTIDYYEASSVALLYSLFAVIVSACSVMAAEPMIETGDASELIEEAQNTPQP